MWSIRAELQLERRTRDLAIFNLEIDSKLRGCDLVALRVDDVALNGYAVDRATIRQRKTGGETIVTLVTGDKLTIVGEYKAVAAEITKA